MKKSACFLFCIVAGFLMACTSGEESPADKKLPRGEAIDSLHALQEEPNRKTNSQVADTIPFQEAFDPFFTALRTTDTAMLEEFIHPELGVWIIEQPGAVPKMTRVFDIRSFKRHYQHKPFFSVAQEVKECDLKEEPFPAFNCAAMDGGRSGYTKDGCFVWKPENFRSSGYWSYASLTEAQIDQIKATLPLIKQSVLHTGTSFEFHFGYVNQQWVLLFAKLIYPCSA